MASRRGRSLSFPVVAGLTALLAVTGTIGVALTAALFTSEYPVSGEFGAGRVFPGDREAVPFDVTDASGGSPVDASNPYAHANDNLTATSAAWDSAFAPDRYIDFALNAPLPSGIGVPSASVSLRLASSVPAGSACFWLEIRTESSGALLEAHGSPGSPEACVNGDVLTTSTISLGAVATTTVANDLRVRVYGRDSTSSGMVIDAMTVAGDYGLASFTLYPVEIRDQADTTPGVMRWGLAGP
jgi:hypothetical protein